MKRLPHELEVQTFDSRVFTCHRKGDTATMIAEASDLGHWMQRLYNDACDVGFGIRSHVTERVIRFAVVHEEVDNEGDVLHWELRPVQRDLRGGDLCRYKVLVIND
jgi:hypothetical protein